MLRSASQLPPPAATTGPAAIAAASPWPTLAALLHARVAANPTAMAIIELGAHGEERRRLTWADVGSRAAVLAAALPPLAGPTPAGRGVVLSVERSADFLCGLLAILQSGRCAVPVAPPLGSRHAGRAQAILSGLRFGAVLADGPTTEALRRLELGTPLPPLVRVDLPAEHQTPRPGGCDASAAMPCRPTDLAIVQYTSGSTREPRGVMLTHANVLANLRAIQAAMGLSSAGDEVLVSWLPPYHDMGLVGGFLNALHLGATLVALPTSAFLRRPLVWLETISRYRGTFSGAPNFAYQLCVDAGSAEEVARLDLSSWGLAFNGAEPVSVRTCTQFTTRFAAARFAPGALYPCYGLAESVVMSTGGRRGAGVRALEVSRAGLTSNRIEPPRDAADLQPIVSCGQPVPGQALLVVDPETLAPLGDDVVGELVLAGPSVGLGYLEQPRATAESFAQTLATGAAGFLRTGDLGFTRAGEAYVAGRVKDLVIINGENHHPADLEQTAGGAAPELKPEHCCMVPEWDPVRGTDTAVLVAAVRTTVPTDRLAAIAEAVQAALGERHGVRAAEIVFVKPGALPRTTSGKPQRQLGRTQLREGGLPVRWSRRWTEAAAANRSASATPLERLRTVVAAVGGPADLVDPALPWERLGLDSVDRVRLLLALEDEFAVRLDLSTSAAGGTIGQVLAAIAAAPARPRPPTPAVLPELARAATPELEIRQAAVWRDEILRPYDAFQDITGLALDNPVQVLRIARAMESFPAIGPARAVPLAEAWVRREQLTGWFYHVPRVQDRLADPERAAPDLWQRLGALVRHAPRPAVVTLFHTSGWDWLLALLIRAAVDNSCRVVVLYDAAVAELNDPLQKRFDVLTGHNTRSLRSAGAVVLVDLRDPNLDGTLVRMLDEGALIVSMPDAVHGTKARAGLVEVPFLGGTLRLASGLYQIAAMRRIPLLHLVHAHTADGPRVTLHVDPGLEPSDAADGALAAALARQLGGFTRVLAEDPAQWRQWRALVPTPTAVPPAPPGRPWFDAERFLVLPTGPRVWLMCRISQRTFALPRDTWAALQSASDEASFRATALAQGVAAETLTALLWVIRGTDPHGLLV